MKSDSSGYIFTFLAVSWCVICVSVSLIQIADSLNISLKEILKKFSILFFLQVTSVGIIYGVNYLTSTLLDSLVYSLSYYNIKILTFGFYILNSMMAVSLTITIYLERNKGHFLPIANSVQIILHCHALCVCIFIVIMGFVDSNVILYSFCLYVYDVSLSLNLISKGLKYIPKIGKYLYHGKCFKIKLK